MPAELLLPVHHVGTGRRQGADSATDRDQEQRRVLSANHGLRHLHRLLLLDIGCTSRYSFTY
jgi:hypothetical protein